ncbi:hypothetical protein MVES1_001237 [Malassezia vespertilionis]|uniref:uncharacterized protein n=1 Tax=Malassezia vespertilionis TaxID=2020962 RepID=UPI0024B1B84E|nr:uncharacterized protein MVES1_001237 [Malassezia vespertilionis]WFD05903.1 hypothetical protein MVES1_001237 [Malassezia vespertilionis]
MADRTDTPEQHSDAECAGDTADDLFVRLLQCDDQLADLLRTAATAIRALAEDADGHRDTRAMNQEEDMFEAQTQHWLSTLNDIQLTLRETAHALRQARIPPLTQPADAHARLSGEAGVAGPVHALHAATPWSFSLLRLREASWRHVAENVARADLATLGTALARGAQFQSRVE